jgi:hypothetical protein
MVTRDHGAHGAHEHEGQHGAARGERNVAQGTITSVSGTGFVLATEEGELTVIASANTNFHGLSRRRAREAGYQDPTAINILAALRVGQRVGVMGERRDGTALLTQRVHGSKP